MDTDRILDLLFYVLAGVLPAIITGLVAYYFFKMHTANEEGRRRYLIHKEGQKNAMPIRLQAYERLVLFLERINPSSLLIRVAPQSSNKKDYEDYLISQIEQEYEHNLTQQIYVSAESWDIITTTKNATIQLIRKSNIDDTIDTADKLREVILTDLFDKQSPSNVAVAYLKNEVGEMW
ncbi:hypothetical protein DVK85_11200 [Flavobacterium arcticum]|uniref:Uncharacterized protein n=1 Tax=Flavobacterium arcticum TaxID=1784713 RepID=A0A345HDV5_9FLAO|nr:hypothetical protein [Flavobacterium arcticum]AXG74765.1 hypothetical protein DVK85_11200 [Flavobacterium arcticum]KAF2509735.1 hypothetical protein E0W72_09475 [Flavobacterium arcticum]